MVGGGHRGYVTGSALQPLPSAASDIACRSFDTPLTGWHMSDKVMNGVSYTGAFVSVLTGMTLTEWGIVVGIVTALLTFGANIYYQVRKDRREQRLHDLEVQFIYKARLETADEGGQQ